MRNILKIIALFIILSIMCSCNPDQFTLNKKYGEPIQGVIISGLDGVVTPGELDLDNALQLNEGGIAAIRRNDLTQFTADFTVNVQQGEGIRFSLRNISDHHEAHDAINFDYTLKGCMVSGTGIKELFVDSVKASLNTPARVKILNLGKVLTIMVNCDTVYNTKVGIPATEYIVLKSLNNSKILLTGIDFIDETKEQ